MKIVDFTTFKETVEKLDAMTEDDPSKINIFPNKSERKDIAQRMKDFLEVADGNPNWTV